MIYMIYPTYLYPPPNKKAALLIGISNAACCVANQGIEPWSPP